MKMDFNPDALECPRCGKRVLVSRGEGHYHCLWCGFKRDISEPEEGFQAFWTMIPFGIILALILV